MHWAAHNRSIFSLLRSRTLPGTCRSLVPVNIVMGLLYGVFPIKSSKKIVIANFFLFFIAISARETEKGLYGVYLSHLFK